MDELFRAADAAAERARQHWLERQAVEDASLAGVLADLAEQRADAAVFLRTGAVRSGPVTAVGQDFVELSSSVLLPLAAVAGVRAAVGPVAGWARPSDITLAGELSRLADSPVRVEADGHSWSGVVVAAGDDVVVLAAEGGTVYVPLASVVCVLVL